MSNTQGFGHRLAKVGSRPTPAMTAQPTLDRGDGPTWTPGLIGTLVVGVVVLACSVVWLMTPFTQQASSVSYSVNQVKGILGFESAKPLLSKEALKDYEDKFGINVSEIMLPAARERSIAMRQVAEQCITTMVDADSPMIVMPTNSFAAFSVMTDYLICAMKTDTQRLCDVTERQRLVTQLMRYRQFREQVRGFERGIKAMLDIPIMQFGFKMSRAHQGPQGPVGLPTIGDDFDPRITAGIATLNRAGHLAAADFPYGGLILPAEYAPSLTNRATQCG